MKRNSKRVKVNPGILSYFRYAVLPWTFGCTLSCGLGLVGFRVVPECLQPCVKTSETVIRVRAIFPAFMGLHIVRDVANRMTVALNSVE